MSWPILLRRWLILTAGALGTLLVLAVALGAALEAGYFRAPLIRAIASRVGRSIEVDGDLRLHLFSLHPQVIAERVTIGNPSWVPPGTTAVIGRLSFALQLPWIHRPLGIETLDIKEATLTLSRDGAGLANWQWMDPRVPDNTLLPLVRRLSMPDARVLLKDDTRHLDFDGMLTEFEPKSAEGPPPVRIEGAGQLNGRPARFGIDGDPLATAEHTKPYRFKFEEQSSGSRIIGSGALPRPFDFRLIDAVFTAAGPNLDDLYFLTGVRLINTGPYRLAGTVARRGNKTRFTELEASSGRSDARGSASVDSSSDRPQLDIDLRSETLRTADLGARAAGLERGAERWLISDAALNPRAWRRDDAVATLRARRLEVGSIALQDVAAALTVDHGLLTVDQLTGHVWDGALSAHVRANLTTDDPADSLDLKLSNLNLERYAPHGADQPPLKGLLQARVLAKGRGRSLHEFASHADGTLSAALPHGAIRTALADLAGFDLRAIGLFADKHGPETAVRCGVASFQAHDGTLAAQTLVLDTEQVLILGEGSIHMDSEAIDLTLRAHPKRPGLRIRSPALVRGTLLHPSLAMRPRDVVAQTAAAVTLGVLLTPLASALAFVDPGLSKDADCGALMQEDKATKGD
ncbi:MAG TPA: AsmA family protein [Steroidobacteraceae bacterium]|nr:AsmA family protein [Steroidobacteraceae bacterium]